MNKIDLTRQAMNSRTGWLTYALGHKFGLVDTNPYCPPDTEEKLKDFLWELLRFTDGQPIQIGEILVSKYWDGEPDSETMILLSQGSKEIIL